MRYGRWKGVAGALALLLAAGCDFGSGGKAADEGKGDGTDLAESASLAKLLSEPVELDVYIHSGSYTLEQFMVFYGNAIKKKYPNISFKLHVPTKGSSLSELLAQGVNIDLIQSHRANTFELMYDLKLQTDISDLIKTYKYDLNTIEPVVLEEMRQLGGGGIMGLPYESRITALFYNKELFDKYGVPYPKANMTWDDMLETAKKLSRVDGGTVYQGFLVYPRHVFLMNQLSQGYVDPVGNKALLNNNNWKSIFQTLQQFYQLANNPYITPNNVSNTFWIEGRAAMYASMFVPDAKYMLDAKINWDVAPYPELKEQKGVGSGMLNYYFNLTSVSQNREQAFLAASFLASEEYQRAQAEQGYNPSLKGSGYKELLGKGVPQYASRNLKAMVSAPPAASYQVNKYQGIADKALDSAFDQLFAEGKDINTSLREAEESANKKIQQAMTGGN